jgi:hypothetical protein
LVVPQLFVKNERIEKLGRGCEKMKKKKKIQTWRS